MNWLPKAVHSRERGAALIIVLAFVVLLTGVAIAYFSRATSDRQVAHSSFNQSNVDQLAQSAMDNIIGDLRQEIVNGSTATTADGVTIYTPASAANMVPQRSGNAAGAPNLIRRSVRGDQIPAPGVASRASAVNSMSDVSAGGRYVTSTRWNGHYLLPKGDTATDDSSPIPAFTNATPDWVFVTSAGATPAPAPANVIGRYAYAIYDEGGLLDMNVAGYPTGTTAVQSGRKGSVAFADLTALGTYPIPNPNASGVYQIDRLVGWRNYGTTQPTNNFPDTGPPANKAFAYNFQTDTAPATAFYNYVINNTNGFLSPNTLIRNGRTDQTFIQRQELIAFRKATQFSANALQYLSTFSRETNSPSFSPSTPTAINPKFLLTRVTTTFIRFDGTTAVVGEPLVKTRFPLNRLAWITYKGPSSTRTFPPQLPVLPPTDPNYDMWSLLWTYSVPQAFLQAGTAVTIQNCFGLTFGGNTGDPWSYSHGAANRILRLDEVAAAGREPDFFELLQAGILNGSLGQNTGGGVTGQNIGGAGLVFPDIHMSSTTHHILTIGACIIDQADPDSVPTRIQFTGTNGNMWTAYGVENLPYITQLYPIAGTSPNNPTKWATYLLFQLWNPHQNSATSTPLVRLRVDGGIGIFTGGNSEIWSTGSTAFFNANGALAGQNVTIKPAVFSVPAPLTIVNTSGVPAPPGTERTFTVLAPPPAVPTPTP